MDIAPNLQPPDSIAALHERASRPTAAGLAVLNKIDGDVCVLGAGGKMGFHLTRMLVRGFQLCGRPNRVIAVSRFSSETSRRLFYDYGLETCSHDLLRKPFPNIINDCQIAYFLAGVKFGTTDSPQLLRDINITVPAIVANQFAERRIVALSSGCVYPFVPSSSAGSTEGDIVAPNGDYAESCVGREQAFVSAGVSSCLIRLNYSVDLQYGVLVDIARKVAAQEPVDLTMGFVNAIWQGDAIDYVLRSVELCRRPSEILNITGSSVLSVRRVAERFSKLFNVPLKVTGTEAPTALLNNAARAHDLLGLPTVSENTLIEWIAHWIHLNLPLLDKPTHFENRHGNY